MSSPSPSLRPISTNPPPSTNTRRYTSLRLATVHFLPLIFLCLLNFPLSLVIAASTGTALLSSPLVTGLLQNSNLLAVQFSSASVVGASNPNSRGVGFILLDSGTNQVRIYVADVVGLSSPPIAAAIGNAPSGANGPIFATFPTSSTFVDNTGFGYAFAGSLPVSASLLQSLSQNTKNFYMVIATSPFLSGAIRGQILSPADTAKLLPNILFPPGFVGSGGLSSALSASLTVTQVQFSTSTSIGNPGTNPVLPITPVSNAYPYLNITLEGISVQRAYPAAAAAIRQTQTVPGGRGISANGGSAPTTLTSFVSTLIPTLPALTQRLPSVSSGQFAEAGSAALLATLMAFIGSDSTLSANQILMALTAALNAAVSVTPGL